MEGTPLLFVDLVINSFNRIYKNKDNEESLLLVRWNGSVKEAVIEMNLVFNRGFYEIKTAFVREKNKFKETELL